MHTKGSDVLTVLMATSANATCSAYLMHEDVISPKSYTLSASLSERGAGVSEHFTAQHVIGETVVLSAQRRIDDRTLIAHERRRYSHEGGQLPSAMQISRMKLRQESPFGAVRNLLRTEGHTMVLLRTLAVLRH